MSYPARAEGLVNSINPFFQILRNCSKDLKYGWQQLYLHITIFLTSSFIPFKFFIYFFHFIHFEFFPQVLSHGLHWISSGSKSLQLHRTLLVFYLITAVLWSGQSQFFHKFLVPPKWSSRWFWGLIQWLVSLSSWHIYIYIYIWEINWFTY